MLKGSVPLASRVEIHLDQALHTAHPQETIMVDDGADVSRQTAASLKRFLYHMRLEIIEIQSRITAYPQAVVNRIDSQRTYKTRTPLIFSLKFQTGDVMDSLLICQADPSSPCAYPELAVMIGSKSRHTIMGQTRIGCCVMDKVGSTFLTKVQASFYRSHP